MQSFEETPEPGERGAVAFPAPEDAIPGQGIPGVASLRQRQISWAFGTGSFTPALAFIMFRRAGSFFFFFFIHEPKGAPRFRALCHQPTGLRFFRPSSFISRVNKQGPPYPSSPTPLKLANECCQQSGPPQNQRSPVGAPEKGGHSNKGGPHCGHTRTGIQVGNPGAEFLRSWTSRFRVEKDGKAGHTPGEPGRRGGVGRGGSEFVTGGMPQQGKP